MSCQLCLQLSTISRLLLWPCCSPPTSVSYSINVNVTHAFVCLLSQSVVEACDLHVGYHISVEFTRALREAIKQLMRSAKLPSLAAAHDRGLWLRWVDALIGFELRLGPLLGLMVMPEAEELPPVLLQHSTLSVLGEEGSWMVSGHIFEIDKRKECTTDCYAHFCMTQNFIKTATNACCASVGYFLLATFSCSNAKT